MKPVYQEKYVKLDKDMLINLIYLSKLDLKSLLEYQDSISLKYIDCFSHKLYMVFNDNELILITDKQLKARVQFKKLVSENKGYGKNFGKEYGYGI